MPRSAKMIFGHTMPVSAMGEKQRLGKIIKLGKGDRRHIGKAYVIMVIEIPILLRDIEWCVRAGKGHNAEERLCSFLTGLLLSSKVEDLSTGLEFDIVIVILLHCAHTGAGFNNAVQRCSRGDESWSRRPVGNPLVIRRIYICRQPFLEAVKLIGADEMHLPGQEGLIAERAHEMRHCRER